MTYTIATKPISTSFLGFNEDGFPLVEIIGSLDLGSGRVKYVDTVRAVQNLLQAGDGNTKLRKNRARGFRTVGLSLSPHKSAGLGNLCPHASAGCVGACLNHQGMASVWESIHLSRIAKTVAFYCAREWFIDKLATELTSAQRSADRAGFDLCCRLNVFSDVAWERVAPELFDDFRAVQFYDYTKNPSRVGRVRPNYWVTFSRSEVNQAESLNLLDSGCNATVVFTDGNLYVGSRKPEYALPKTWCGFPVLDGDESDLRFLDSRGRKHGRVVGLKLKAASYHELQGAIDSGFAVVL